MDALHRLIGPDASWTDQHDGASGSVLRVSARGGVYWAKHGPTARAEHDRLRWLAPHLPTPAITAFDGEVLVLADVGAPSLLRAAPADIGAVFGRALRALHRLPVADCPFDARLPTVLARAEANVREGRVDPADFDADHTGLTARAVLDRLRALAPSTEDVVVAHGDYTTANVLLADEPVVIDVPWLGVACRYRDLAIAHRDLTHGFGPAAWSDFRAAYGLDRVDDDRLYYYRLLDELL